jgi:hypothetical protein
MNRFCNLDAVPKSWTDPLEFYGPHLHALRKVGCNLDTERKGLQELVSRYGAAWVWCNRKRLASAAKALRNLSEGRTSSL